MYMAEIIFFKTAAFGGYDKDDVDKYLYSLYSQISELKNQLSETRFSVEKYMSGTEQEKIYESMLSDKRTECTKLQAQNQSLSQQLENLKAENQLKEQEITNLKESIKELEEDISETNIKLASLQAGDDVSALSMVFVEAKKSADILKSKAKKEACDLEINSKKIAEDLINDANKKALKIIADADNNSKQMEVASENMKALMLNDVNKINKLFFKLKDAFNELQESGGELLGKSEKVLADAASTLKENGVPVFKLPDDYKPDLPDAFASGYDDSEFISELNSVNVLSDNFMDDFQNDLHSDNLEHDLMEFETGRVNNNSNHDENISLEDIAKQAEAINDKNNSKDKDKDKNDNNSGNSGSLSLEELARQAEAIN